MTFSGSTLPLVSVMVVSYNQERYIRQALQSAIDQDYPRLEIVVSDDASTDGTAEIIRQMTACSGGRIRALIQPHNLGVTGNCNAALAACQGDYIAFMGGDDYFLPGKITKQIEWFQKNTGAVLCGHAVDVVDEQGVCLESKFGDIGPLPEGRGACDMIRMGNPFPAVSVMIAKASLPSGGFDSRMPVLSDWKLWLDVVGEDGAYGYIEGRWAAYRRHALNITQQIFWPLWRDILLTAVVTSLQWKGKCVPAWGKYFFSRLFRN